MTNTSIRVLQGTINIANQMNTQAKGLERLGVPIKTANHYQNYLNYPTKYDLNIELPREIMAAQLTIQDQIIPAFDLFHFHFATSLQRGNVDLPLLAANGKPICMQHWGSEVRMLSKALKTNPFAKVKLEDEGRLQKKLEELGQYIPFCVVADHELIQYVQPFYEEVHVIPSMIDLRDYKKSWFRKKRKRPLIVHAPTHVDVKGTPHILQAVEQLKLSYSFDFKLIHGMAHHEAKKWYKKADLIIDQLHIGSYGLFAVEAMALGKPVICYISDYMAEHYPKDLPIISANPETIFDTLKNLLKNQDQLTELGKKGRAYVKKEHNMDKNAARLLNLYELMMGNKKG
ncbi:glycosyltransferase family 4 protein [Halalkalibacter oceani]|uniref:Glycosyltransferase family 4 protein n=1 Tax=Halalkalibacter oceani TaxID=1653776 RepID=A0A9X2DR30_9BACI|nr:glycosyltransferase family 4 protein [Halalkalibacter oceani]MCM3715556.1 glycosyltransferase family 4 protein [Halalkalibacter oceani]